MPGAVIRLQPALGEVRISAVIQARKHVIEPNIMELDNAPLAQRGDDRRHVAMEERVIAQLKKDSIVPRQSGDHLVH